MPVERPPRFSVLELRWLELRYPDGQHCPLDCEDVFVVAEGLISRQDSRLYVLAADDGEVLRTGTKLADVVP